MISETPKETGITAPAPTPVPVSTPVKPLNFFQKLIQWFKNLLQKLF